MILVITSYKNRVIMIFALSNMQQLSYGTVFQSVLQAETSEQLKTLVKKYRFTLYNHGFLLNSI